jgi:drug/metabolite transporter (DMT)-like permease
LWGQVAVLLAALSYAVTAVYGRRFRDLPPAGAAAGTLTTASLMILPLAALVDGPTFAMPHLGAIAAMAALALLCTAYAYILYFRVLASAGPTNLMLVTFLIPVSAILLGVTLLSEPLEAHHIGGLCLILAGLSLVDGRILRVAGPRTGK